MSKRFIGARPMTLAREVELAGIGAVREPQEAGVGLHRADDFIRLSYATSMPQLEEAVGRLQSFFGNNGPNR